METNDILTACNSRVASYANFGLIDLLEYESWLNSVTSFLNSSASSSGFDLGTHTNSTSTAGSTPPTSTMPEPMSPLNNWTFLCSEYDGRYQYFWNLLTISNWVQIFICILGIIFNCIFIMVVWKRKLHSSTDVYFLNFAVADQMICLSVMLKVIPFFSSAAVVVKVTSGDAWAVWVDGFMQSSLYAAMITSACFTLERALAVCDPLKSMRLCTRNKSVRICVVSWILSVTYNVITGVLKLVIYEHLPDQRDVVDNCLFLIELTLFYIAPLIVSTICYCMILRALRARAEIYALGTVHGCNVSSADRSVGTQSNPTGNKRNHARQFSVPVTETDKVSSIQGSTPATVPGCRRQMEMRPARAKTNLSIQTTSEHEGLASSAATRPPKREQTHQHLSANRKVTRLMFLVMLAFVLLLSPHRLWNLARFFKDDLTSFVRLQLINQICSTIYICNSIVNPVICCLCSEIYRKQLKTTFCRNYNERAALLRGGTNNVAAKQSSNIYISSLAQRATAHHEHETAGRITSRV